MRSARDADAESGAGAVELRLLLREPPARARLPPPPPPPANPAALRNGGVGSLSLAIPPYRASPPSSPESTPTPTPTGEGAFSRRRSDRRLRRLNTELLEAIELKDFEEAERSLEHGANPNATCRLDMVSACHLAAAMGSEQILAMLINRGAERNRMDRRGRTPLHLAAWGGHNKCVAILLHFPESLQRRLDGVLSQQTELEVRYCASQLRSDLVNVRCVATEERAQLPKDWKDSFDHECKDVMGVIPLIGDGWTPLHVAAAGAQPDSTQLLLLAGGDVHAHDQRARTPLDVLGAAFYHQPDQIDAENFLEVLKMLLEAGASHKTMSAGGVGMPATPLHTAVELNCPDAVRELLEAGANPCVFNDDGDTPLHTCVRRQFEDPLLALVGALSSDEEPFQQNVDLKNAQGYTALQLAVIDEWISGVSIALEGGADVGVQAYDGETSIHAAAALGNPELLLEILSVAKTVDAIDSFNAAGETAIFKAIAMGNIECVRVLMKEGASLTKTMPGEVTTIHRAAEFGFSDILLELLKADKRNTGNLKIDALCDEKRQGFGAIHFAALNDRAECVRILLENGANVRLRTTAAPHAELTALHVAAMLEHTSVVDTILAFDKFTVHETDGHGWLPIHTAAHHGSRETIPKLVQAGADLASVTKGHTSSKRTAIDILVNNFTRPTEYLEELFDSYISLNDKDVQDSNCEVQVDYSVLMPKNSEMEQMQVVVALIKTGNRYGQRRLLLHPLVESFLHLKWMALSPFFYVVLIMYCAFTIALTNLVTAIYSFEDIEIDPPEWLSVDIWGPIMLGTIVLILLKKLLYFCHNPIGHAMQTETWVSAGSVTLAATIPFIHSYITSTSSSSTWPRHIATLAILLAWTHLMLLLSHFPKWGYYVLMFSKVASTVMKILLTFAFLVVGFSLSFMIQFHSQVPFDGPLSALIKTIVMMTSEFEYEAQFDEELSRINSFSLYMVRVIFVTFVVLASIVLMNLLVGVAVNDINDLETLGHIKRLANHVEFLGTLDVFVYNRVFNKIFPSRFNKHIRGKRNIDNVLKIYHGGSKWMNKKSLPKKIKDAIYLKASKKKMINDEAVAMKKFSKQIDDIHEATVKRLADDAHGVLKVGEDRPRHHRRHEELLHLINSLNSAVAETQLKLTEYTADTRAPIKDMSKKLDHMHREIEQLKRIMSSSQRIQSLPPSPDTIS